jgi:ATP synthase protein I
MVLELVIGMVLGFGIGFGLDKWLATAPLMMIIMSLFGFAAGIRTMMMTANEFIKLNKKVRTEE